MSMGRGCYSEKSEKEFQHRRPREISLLPVCHKVLSNAIFNRIIPTISNKIDFWQRAYLNKRYRQELIFSLKTTFDDFRHKRTKLTSVFIDFAGAFGRINHQFLSKALQYFDMRDIYNWLIEDLYKYSFFKLSAVLISRRDLL